MDVNLRLENPSVDHQGRRCTFHLDQQKIINVSPVPRLLTAKRYRMKVGIPQMCADDEC
jgi:hypothetical protein